MAALGELYRRHEEDGHVDILYETQLFYGALS
jgi:hypothetical protein